MHPKTIVLSFIILFSCIVIIVAWYSLYKYIPPDQSVVNNTLSISADRNTSTQHKDTNTSTAYSGYFHLELVNSTGKVVVDNEKKIITIELDSLKNTSLFVQGVIDRVLPQTLSMYSDVNVTILNDTSRLYFELGFTPNGSVKEMLVNGVYMRIKQLSSDLFRLDIKVDNLSTSPNTITTTIYVRVKGEYIEVGTTYTLKIKIHLGQ